MQQRQFSTRNTYSNNLGILPTGLGLNFGVDNIVLVVCNEKIKIQ